MTRTLENEEDTGRGLAEKRLALKLKQKHRYI